jgi:predicted  nucleic acid-binding Zn-ribbon protein
MPSPSLKTLVLIALSACFATIAAAQTASPPPQETTLQALLNEVRALRIALERSNQIAPRIQIALARMQFQQEHVRNGARQAESAHDEVSHLQLKRTEVTDNIKEVESRLNQSVDQNERKGMEHEIAGLKAELERLNAQELQARTRESESSALLQTEQAKWVETNDQLAAMERALYVPDK